MNDREERGGLLAKPKLFDKPSARMIAPTNPCTPTPAPLRQRPAPHWSALLALAISVAAVPGAEPVDKEEPVPDAAPAVGDSGGGGGAPDPVFTATATLPFYDGFESGSLGGFWMTSGTALGRVLVTTNNGPFSGVFHTTFDTPANGTNHRAELTLALDLTGFTNVVLRFRAREYGDEANGPPTSPFTNSANFDGVAISTDGVLWHEVLGLLNLSSTYAQRTINLNAALASNGLAYGPNFLIRFNQYDNFPIPTDGIAIDEVNISGLLPGTPGVFIEDASILEGTGTFPLLTFPVRLDQPGTNLITVNYTTADGTASSAGDFIPATGTVTFQPGETNSIIVVPIVGDDQNEPNETFRVTLAGPVNAVLGNLGATGTILNDDLTLITVAPATVVEGDAGTTNALFQVTLSRLAGEPTTVSFATADNLATAGLDYLATNGAVVLPPGVTSTQIVVTVLNDLVAEGDEVFTLFLAASANATLSNSQALGTILDDDNVPGKLSRFQFDPIASPQRTGSAFPVKITALDPFGSPVTGFAGPVALAGVAGVPDVALGSGSASFNYPFSTFFHDARLQSIYLASEFNGPVQIRSLGLNVTALPGQPMINWTIRVKHTPLTGYGTTDPWDSTGWTTVFQTNLTVTSTGLIVFPLATPFNYNGTDNLMVDFTFNNTSFTTDGLVLASDTGVSRSLTFRTDSGFGDPLTWAARNPAPQPVTLRPNLLINGGVALPVAISPTSSGAFSNGMWSGNVAVLQAAEQVALRASDGAGRANLSDTFTVLDGSALTLSSASRPEGDEPDTVNLTVRLSFPAEQLTSVDFVTLSDSATAGEDFVAANGTITFNPGESEKQVPLTIRGDRTPELDESFRVALTNPVNATLFRPVGTVTLLNDDSYGPLSLSPRASWQVNGNVNAVVEHEGVVYLGGAFTEAGDLNVDKLATFARADGAVLPGAPSIDRNVTTVIDDGAGGWFVGGQFSTVGGQPRLRLVHLLPDLSVDPAFVANFNNNVNALVLDGTNLYVGGQFTTVTNAIGVPLSRSRLALLDAATGQPRSFGIEPAFDNTINALALQNGVLFVGGQFAQVNFGGDTYFRTRLAALDAATGSLTSLAIGVNNTINTLLPQGERLYLGGAFTAVDELPRFRLAAINVPGELVESWAPQLSGQVFAFLPAQGALYVGGGFTSLTNNGVRTVRSNLVVLDPVTGAPGPLAPNPTGNVRALALDGAELFLGGDFQTIGAGLDRRRGASLDLNTGAISDFDPDASGGVFGLSLRSNFVFAGGQFTFVKGTLRGRLAALDAFDGRLLPWNPAANNTVWALAAAGDDVFATGQFTSVGGINRQRLVALNRLTGTGRASFQANLNATGRALGLWNDQLIVGGDFVTVTPGSGAVPRSGLASVSLATGTVSSNFVADAVPFAGSTSNIWTMVVHRDVVYFSGAFTQVGGMNRLRLAAVGAETGAVQPWSPSVSTNVFALAAFDTNIYLGGEFTTVTNASGGAVTRNRLAAVSAQSGNVTLWNPNANNTVASLAVGGLNLYAGGNFTLLAGQSRQRIAELDLFVNTSNVTAWNPDMNASVLALGIGANGRVHAGGAFTSVNKESRRGYAMFDRFGPPEVIVAPAALTFLEDAPPLLVDPALRVYSPAEQPVNGATVRLGGKVAGEDVLTASPPASINASYDAALGVLTFTGIASATDYELALRSVAFQNTSGAPTIEFRATNDSGPSAVASRSIQVLSVNDAPSFTKGPNVVVDEDSGPASVPQWATNISPGPGEAGQFVEFLVSNDNPALFAAPPSISPGGGLKFTPAPDAFGSATVTVVLRDNGGTANGGVNTAAPQTFLLAVRPVNDPPTALPRSILLTEDTAANITLLGADIDGDPLTFLIGTGPAHGALSGTPPTVTYTPTLNYHGPDAFTYRASDGQAQSAPATVSLTVLSVNDAPVADASATVSPVTAPNNVEALVVLDGSRSSDVEGDALTYLWFIAGTTNHLGSGVVVSNVLPVGTNFVELIVSDETDLGSNLVEVVVRTPAGAVRDLIAFVEQAGLSRNERPLIASLEVAIASFNRNNFTSGVNHLRAFQKKVRAQVEPGNPALAATLNRLAQEIIDLVTAPPGG